MIEDRDIPVVAKKAREKSTYVSPIPRGKKNDTYLKNSQFILLDTIDKLKEVLNRKYITNSIGVDTETTGLNIDTDTMVGYSFCLGEVFPGNTGGIAYYVPVCHESGGLGKEAVDLIYIKMKQSDKVYMFNARFDIRVFEYYGFVQNNIPMEERDRLGYCYYDMSIINIIDAQTLVFLMDTNIPYPSLKKSEDYYFGWRGDSFEETLSKGFKKKEEEEYIDDIDPGEDTTIKVEKESSDNFYYIDPVVATPYAATDALGTYKLGNILYNKVYIEEKPEYRHSVIFDLYSLYPLMIMENEYIEIDTRLLDSYSYYYHKELEKLQLELDDISGIPGFKIGSTKERAKVLEGMGLRTGAVGASGTMSTGKKLLEELINSLESGDKKRRLLEGIIEYGNLRKQQSTYVDNIIKMASESLNPPKLRFSYKTMVVPTGRLAAGGDKKNKFFSLINIQNIPKPPGGNIYYIEKKYLSKEVLETMNNTLEEGIYKEEKIYGILDWVFKETPWRIDGVKEYLIEGFIQNHKNIRSAFLPGDNRYWVSVDFSGEELRIATIFSKEDTWMNAFEHGDDIHKATALSIWGSDQYTKAKRKKAKGANFCETKENFILTASGYKHPDRLSIGETLITREGTDVITNLTMIEKEPCIRVQFNNGIIGTYHEMHKLYCFNGDTFEWKRVKDLTEEDQVIAFTDKFKTLDYKKELSRFKTYKLGTYIKDSVSKDIPDFIFMWDREFIESFLIGLLKVDPIEGINFIDVKIFNKNIVSKICILYNYIGYSTDYKGANILEVWKSNLEKYPVKVVSKEYITEDIYAIECAKHEYIANSMNSHNSILYGATAHRLQAVIGGTIEEAEVFMADYKKALPKLFKWIHKQQELGKSQGYVRSYFGRKRYVYYYYSDMNNLGLVSFGDRTCVNNTIQGTGADILKRAFLMTYREFFKEDRRKAREDIKYLNTVHDEINFGVKKELVLDMIPRIIKNMRYKPDSWPFGLEVGLEIGTRWGRTIGFKYDPNTFEVIGPDGEEYIEKPEEVKIETESKKTKEEIKIEENRLMEVLKSQGVI